MISLNRILITGHKGFIGSHLMRLFEEEHPIGIDLKEGKDIRNCQLPKDIDIVYHSAAKRSVPDSFNEPQEFFSTNVYGTYRLVKEYPNARFVNTSSSTAETRLSPYGESKYLAEQITKKHNNSVSLRLFSVFGEGQTYDMLIPNFIKAMLHDKEIIIFGDGKQKRDFTYIKDVVGEITDYGKSKFGGVWGIGYGTPRSVNEIFELLSPYFDYQKQPIYTDERRGDQRYTCAGNVMHKIIYGFDEGLKNTIEWWKNGED